MLILKDMLVSQCRFERRLHRHLEGLSDGDVQVLQPIGLFIYKLLLGEASR